MTDATLAMLPIIFHAGRMCVLDLDEALDLMNPVKWTCPTERAYKLVGTPSRSLWRSAQQIGLRIASFSGRQVIDWTPPRVRPAVRQSLVHARNSLLTIARPTNSRQLPSSAPPHESLTIAESLEPCAPRDGTDASLSRFSKLSTVVHPTTKDIVWTGATDPAHVPFRQLAEAKLTSRFRLVSVCYDMKRVLNVACGPPGLSGSLATHTLDQLDASDLILCVSNRVQRDLLQFARDNGRAAPNTRLLLLDSHQFGHAVAAVSDGLMSLVARDATS